MHCNAKMIKRHSLCGNINLTRTPPFIRTVLAILVTIASSHTRHTLPTRTGKISQWTQRPGVTFGGQSPASTTCELLTNEISADLGKHQKHDFTHRWIGVHCYPERGYTCGGKYVGVRVLHVHFIFYILVSLIPALCMCVGSFMVIRYAVSYKTLKSNEACIQAVFYPTINFSRWKFPNQPTFEFLGLV